MLRTISPSSSHFFHCVPSPEKLMSQLPKLWRFAQEGQNPLSVSFISFSSWGEMWLNTSVCLCSRAREIHITSLVQSLELALWVYLHAPLDPGYDWVFAVSWLCSVHVNSLPQSQKPGYSTWSALIKTIPQASKAGFWTHVIADEMMRWWDDERWRHGCRQTIRNLDTLLIMYTGIWITRFSKFCAYAVS